ncbi:hypothetical protein I305_06848 [Cryptococcus gattii E566]|uniref:Uncharacterized protein n=2 Tax=Cryptococcus gattii TaxID=37769 RepID=E6RF16_CRYGW|nr:Hypothetical Protein CGB_M0400C [Cryptococcus gattii WM276]ADV25425.1 Hypothetical Protein CGB_M0400C [Cryptococcus gattii WM276]KIR78951.1 hypothetical protein I306_04036 [Cryptococcus gattii EJB2]KIY30768.1 hypothetical protein I305_06848 [Cryptococcus gattii E566]KJD99884.1 hypothetical protein I311_06530 [Cryptococcus gattii NT-10]
MRRDTSYVGSAVGIDKRDLFRIQSNESSAWSAWERSDELCYPSFLLTLSSFHTLHIQIIENTMGIEVTGVKQVTCFTSQATWNTLKHWLLETRENRPPVFR